MANQIIDKALAYIGNWMKTGKPTGYGTNVDITNYTSASNMYTIPSDGLIEINCNYRAGSYIMVYIFNATGTNSSGLVQQSSASDGNAGNSYAQCPVFKGQRVYVQSSNSYSYAYFKPFIYGVVGGVKLKVSSLALMRGWPHEQSNYRQGVGVFGRTSSCNRRILYGRMERKQYIGHVYGFGGITRGSARRDVYRGDKHANIEWKFNVLSEDNIYKLPYREFDSVSCGGFWYNHCGRGTNYRVGNLATRFSAKFLCDILKFGQRLHEGGSYQIALPERGCA